MNDSGEQGAVVEREELTFVEASTDSILLGLSLSSDVLTIAKPRGYRILTVTALVRAKQLLAWRQKLKPKELLEIRITILMYKLDGGEDKSLCYGADPCSENRDD